ncbi:hypothetical protein [Nocardia sp. NPDC127526]|uniref:hypothetical protein n=1 Tax=Nocardia sp. NPDC127526 TaxID=3345393 RepID=UPI003632B86F
MSYEGLRINSEEEPRPDSGDGLLSTAGVGTIGSFLQWSTGASDLGESIGKSFLSAAGLAEGGEPEGRQDYDDGFLATSRPGRLFGFLQWPSWFNIAKSTVDQFTAYGGTAAVQAGLSALVGSVAGPAGAAAAVAVSTLTSSVQNVLQQFTTPPQTQTGGGLPKATPLPQVLPLNNGVFDQQSFGPSIDRTTTINVLKTTEYKPNTSDPLIGRMEQYLSPLL